MTLCRWGIFLAGALVLHSPAGAQSFSDARSLAIGAMPAAVRDTREFPTNPAGLVRLRDWELSLGTYSDPLTAKNGFVFQGLTLGRRFLENDAAAFRYTPGSELTFVVPPVLLLGETNTPASSDREITYREPYALAYAHRFSSQFSVGIGARNRQERVVDIRYQIIIRDTISYPAVVRETYSRTGWFADLALQWSPSETWTFGLVGRNLIRSSTGDDGTVLDAYRLPSKVLLEGGVSASPARVIALFASASSAGTGALGVEWHPGAGFSVRGSTTMSRAEHPMLSAVAAGMGWSYEFFELDAAYLHFLNDEGHRGTTSSSRFSVSDIINLDMHPYSRDRIALSARAIFGHVRESLARIEGVTIIGGIYPASHEIFAFKPIGLARVRNISERPINARVSFFLERYMDAPTESQPVYLAPGGEAEVPITAVFNEQVTRVPSLMIREGNVYVNATPAEEYDDRFQTRVLIHGRNAWDGDVLTLRYFVTPDDPFVLKYSRDVLLEQHDSLVVQKGVPEQFARARMVIAAFAGKLQYVNDPRLSADFVQYPSETLTQRGGDCDDMTVCFASLLSSIGIPTAFVDVIPPEHPEQSHIYLLFDTGVEPRFASSMAGNPKRFVVRRNPQGKETVWIPIETTVIAQGFEEAWSSGAQRYFDDAEIGLGLAHGWVRIVDVN
jgi:hypothetical protein